jgi:hypothetical protein
MPRSVHKSLGETGEIRVVEACHSFGMDDPVMIGKISGRCGDHIEARPTDRFFSRRAYCFGLFVEVFGFRQSGSYLLCGSPWSWSFENRKTGRIQCSFPGFQAKVLDTRSADAMDVTIASGRPSHDSSLVRGAPLDRRGHLEEV